MEKAITATLASSLHIYTVDANYQEEMNPVKMRELNRAAAEMKQIFDPYLEQLDPKIEGDSPSDTL